MKEEDCRGQELCEQGGGPGLSLIPYPVLPPVPNKPYGLCGRKAP